MKLNHHYGLGPNRPVSLVVFHRTRTTIHHDGMKFPLLSRTKCSHVAGYASQWQAMLNRLGNGFPVLTEDRRILSFTARRIIARGIHLSNNAYKLP